MDNIFFHHWEKIESETLTVEGFYIAQAWAVHQTEACRRSMILDIVNQIP